MAILYTYTLDKSKLPVNSPKVNDAGRALFAQMVEEGKILGFTSEDTAEHRIDRILYKDIEAREEHKALFVAIPNRWINEVGESPADFKPLISEDMREATQEEIDLVSFP